MSCLTNCFKKDNIIDYDYIEENESYRYLNLRSNIDDMIGQKIKVELVDIENYNGFLCHYNKSSSWFQKEEKRFVPCKLVKCDITILSIHKKNDIRFFMNRIKNYFIYLLTGLKYGDIIIGKKEMELILKVLRDKESIYIKIRDFVNNKFEVDLIIGEMNINEKLRKIIEEQKNIISLV